MTSTCPEASTSCNCQALRQAARRVTQLYDAALAPIGLRTTQYAILTTLRRPASWSIQQLADHMVMDRTTLGRTIRPLARDGLLTVVPDLADRRSRVLALTATGRGLLDRALPLWNTAQTQFEAGFGQPQAAALRGVLKTLVVTEFPNLIPG